MNQCEMPLVIHRHQIMIVLIHLHRRQLTLVDDGFVAKGTQIKPIMETNRVGSPLPQEEELALEVEKVELLRVRDPRLVPIPVCAPQNHERA